MAPSQQTTADAAHASVPGEPRINATAATTTTTPSPEVRLRKPAAAAAPPTTASGTLQPPQQPPSSPPPAATAAAAATTTAAAAGGGGGGGLQRLLVGVLATGLWMLFSSAVIILNKSLYRRGFAYPSTVTGVGQFFSALSGLLLARLAGPSQRLRPPPPARTFCRALLPIAGCTAATMYLGNLAYLHLSVAFIQILKAFTPAITLLLCLAAGLERPAWPLVGAVGMIAGGTAGAVLVESGTPAFSGLGLAAFMGSSLTEAARVVGAELLKDGSQYNTAESLVYVGGPTALLLLAAAAIWEWPAMLAATYASTAERPMGLALVAADPWVFLAAPAVSSLVNASCFFAVYATSSLTFKVAGCVKNVAVVWYGVLAHGDTVTALQAAGYGVSTAGFMLYSHLKMAARAARRPVAAAVKKET
ncbi:hypothetical protein Agub_g14716 [Astrephomene gubernaculifera]|uniref:Sugar phosphate transporter domain-containing protein n=1 Tax=Astrephomene gubernaculifera TaxID=47775 RepID=A0AAD3E3Y8_9CHLO|nr:hypothetical protein Agub_g14716 [Astrephomene gubernaculifera]